MHSPSALTSIGFARIGSPAGAGRRRRRDQDLQVARSGRARMSARSSTPVITGMSRSRKATVLCACEVAVLLHTEQEWKAKCSWKTGSCAICLGEPGGHGGLCRNNCAACASSTGVSVSCLTRNLQDRFARTAGCTDRGSHRPVPRQQVLDTIAVVGPACRLSEAGRR